MIKEYGSDNRALRLLLRVWRQGRFTMTAIFLRIRRVIDQVYAFSLALIKAVSLVFLLGLFLYVLMTGPALTVLPVSLPTTFMDAGYSPNAASQTVAAYMAHVAGREAGELAITPSIALVASSTLDLPDIQMPGQPFSFRAVSRFVRAVLGRGDPTVSISIARSDTDHVVAATAVGGPYAGRHRSATVPSDLALEKVMMTAAALAVSVVQPLRYAAFLEDMSSSQTKCPDGLTCTPEDLLTLVGELLADDYLEDDAQAHLVYAALSLGERNTTDALQHCDAASAYNETRDWALIYCSYSHLANGKRDRAIETVPGALSVRSDDPDVHAGFGDLFLALDKGAEAEGAYGRAVELDSRHVYSLIGLGTIYRHKRRFGKAGEHYRAALLVNPNELYALGGLGQSLVELGDPAGGLLYLERALCIDPDYKDATTARKAALVALKPTADPATLGLISPDCQEEQAGGASGNRE